MTPEPRTAAPKTSRQYLLGAALLACLVMAPSLLYPFGRDQAVFAYVGHVIARGGMPYQDAWDLKPPGIYALYGLLARIAPDPGASLMVLLRVADVLVAAVTAALLALLARRWGRPEAGLAAGAWYAALYLQGGFWSLAQAEAWANPLVIGSALLLLEATQGPAREGKTSLAAAHAPTVCLAAGVLAGMAAVLKVTTFVPAAPFLIYALWRQPGLRVTGLLGFGAGFLFSILTGVVWLRSGGAWEAYLEIQSGFVAPYARLNAPSLVARLGNSVLGVVRWLGQVWGPALLGSGVGLWAWGRRRSAFGVRHSGDGEAGEGRQPLLALGALAAAAAAVAVQNKFFLYHWETALPWLALVAALGSGEWLRGLKLDGRRMALAATALPLIWSLAGRWSAYRDGALYAAGMLPRERWLARFTSRDRDYSFVADTQVAAWVRENTAPTDTVLVWGFEPAVYLLSERQAPTRFFFNVPVSVPFSPPEWRQEMLRDLRRHPPELVLVLSHDAIPWANGLKEDSAGQLRNLPELRGWLETNYRFETQIEDFAIYRASNSSRR